MEQRKAVVTGATGGIGRAICRKLKNHGFSVTAIARNLAAVPGSGDPWDKTFSADLSDLVALPAFLKDLIKQESDADLVVFCAGIGRFGSLEQLPPSDIEAVLNLNLASQIHLARAFIPHFKRRGSGDLVFIGSEAAHRAGKKGTVYCAAKFGLRGFVQALRQETAARGLRTCLINPGMTDTGFYSELDFGPGRHPNQHLRADDIAQTVMMVVNAPPGTVFDEINLSPATHVIEFSNHGKSPGNL